MVPGHVPHSLKIPSNFRIASPRALVKGGYMKATILVFALLFESLAHAKEQRAHESGTLLQMESVECGAEQKGGKTITGEMLGTDAAHQKTRVLLCQEYVLQTERVIYRIRPKDDKHPVLLPVGTKAQFRMDKDKIK